MSSTLAVGDTVTMEHFMRHTDGTVTPFDLSGIVKWVDHENAVANVLWETDELRTHPLRELRWELYGD